jgi:hypothetical protein
MTNLKIVLLPDSALRLWLKGLCYCQMHLTDGLILSAALVEMQAKKKDVESLCASLVPGKGPLWHRVEEGYRVHDYDAYNDSKAVVEARKAADRDRKKRGRQPQAIGSESDMDSERTSIRTPAGLPMEVPLDSVLLGTSAEDQRSKNATVPRSFPGRRHNPGALGAAVPREHLKHALCGRICLHQAKFDQFVRKVGGRDDVADSAVRQWAQAVLDAWDRPPLLEQSIGGSDFEFWDARYEEWKGGAAKGADRVGPPRGCNHKPWCADDAAHTARRMAERRQVPA